MMKLILLLALLIFPTLAIGGGEPPEWPWKAVTVDNLGGGPADIVQAKDALDIDAVRVSLKIRKYAKRNATTIEQSWADNLIWLDTMLDTCEDQEVLCILGLQDFIFDTESPLSMKSPEFWGDPLMIANIEDTVRDLVTRLSDRGEELGAYDFISEPVITENDLSRQPEAWSALSVAISNIITQDDPDRWRLVSFGAWGIPSSFCNNATMLPGKAIYSVHFYLPHQYTHQGIGSYPFGITYPGVDHRGVYWDQTKMRKKLRCVRDFQLIHDVPIFVGEFSVIRGAAGWSEWLSDVVTIFDDYDWGYAYFNTSGWHGWNPNYAERWREDRRGRWWEEDYLGSRSKRWKVLRKVFD